ncbi:MAG: hypothetical protein JWQ34_964 [Mucilaginibacter sp.]|uniref:SecDF P1 head subdomain-containing protein n=1 Tax=Mucilaginibacter sp. TaxID=1882438 RepID=UPI0026150CE6|nr:hypothetical protein [Mucilaginibacter sp.]MDB5002739.1 hypothetical protein [Mucilaginibacter sp.]
MNFKTLLITAVIFCTPLLLIASRPPKKKLVSGFYKVIDEKGIHLELNHTHKYYDVESTPFVSTRHIVSTAVTLVKFNGTSHPTLMIVFDAEGASANTKASSTGYKRTIGLILNNKLKLAPSMVGNITGNSINISGAYTLEQLKDLKAEIDKSK